MISKWRFSHQHVSFALAIVIFVIIASTSCEPRRLINKTPKTTTPSEIGQILQRSNTSVTFVACDRVPEKVRPSKWRALYNASHIVETHPSFYKRKTLLKGSKMPKRLQGSSGFVYTAIDAYNKHHNLRITPDDVWISILIQFSRFVNANAEAIRHIFVSHEGKKPLDFPRNSEYDWESALRRVEGILERETSQEISQFITSNFTTTTERTRIVSSLVFMSTVQAYFSYYSSILCGIPRITIQGTTSDWEDITRRVDYLKRFGDVPTKWSEMLKPIIQQFINAKNGNVDAKFWSNFVVVQNIGCGSSYLSGWITAFTVFGTEEKWRGDLRSGQVWPVVDLDHVAPEIVTVPFTIGEYGSGLNGTIIVGHMGRKVGKDLMTLSSYAGWAVTRDN